MISFTASTVLPATRDVNAVFCANRDDSTDYLRESYVCRLNGWYRRTSVRMCAGAVDGHCFMVVDDVLISELIDPNPIKGVHVGFSPYCTMLKIINIEIREIYYEELKETYEPEF